MEERTRATLEELVVGRILERRANLTRGMGDLAHDQRLVAGYHEP
jgi:hypothetical protein